MLTVLTPATTTKLTTAAAVRDLLGHEGAENSVLVDKLIQQASTAIVDYCRRPFGLETVRETFRLPDTCEGILLSRSPVVEVVSVTLDGTAMADDEFEHDAATGLLYRLDAGGRRLGWWIGWDPTIQYRAGYILPVAVGSTLPSSVERAAILEVGAYLSARNRPALVRSEAVEGVGSTTYWEPDVSGPLASREAANLLQPYRRLFA